jgi:uncharacterized protein
MDGFGELLMDKNLLRREIHKIRKETNIGWDVIEQDYTLSWVLFGISQLPKLKSTLIFKGGTALRKCFFGDYRFSQDLDFSVQGDYPRQEELLALISEACKIAEQHLDDIEFLCKRYPERDVHPEKQEAFVIQTRFPWQKDFHSSVKVEVTTQEHVLLDAQERTIIHGYAEKLDGSILTYQLEEIIAEKIRAILQFARKLHERGWGRSRVRDYYDLWRILKEYQNSINKSSLPSLVQRKCAIKSVQFNTVDDLFQGRLMEFLNEWDLWLSPMVVEVPSKEMVLEELKEQLMGIFAK